MVNNKIPAVCHPFAVGMDNRLHKYVQKLCQTMLFLNKYVFFKSGYKAISIRKVYRPHSCIAILVQLENPKDSVGQAFSLLSPITTSNPYIITMPHTALR